ncbi:MAG: O-antigen ligase family protein [Hyphomicrobiaceae bacterium]
MGKAFRGAPWPVLLLVLSFLCPTEFSVYVGSVRLPTHRALLIILLPLALFHSVGPKGGRLKLFDVTMLAFASWVLMVHLIHHGVDAGLQAGGSQALDAFASFLVARVYVRDAEAFRALTRMLFVVVAAAGMMALPEALTGRFYVHEFLGQITGYIHPTGVETRLGLTRAFATFDHPIHLGTFCSAGLAMCLYAERRSFGFWARAIIIPASALMGLSSAPMLSVAAQFGLMIAERISRGMRGRIVLGAGVMVAVMLVVGIVATRSPFAIIATGFTLDAWTGYYRLMIWEYGLDNVWAHPWIGLGLNDWARPTWMASPTVDAFWLLVAMRGGIPAIVFLLMTVVLLAWGVARRISSYDQPQRALARGWLISLTGLSLVGCTVHFWNVPYAFFFFLLGLGGWLADPLRAAKRTTAGIPAPKPAKRLQWLPPASLPGHLAMPQAMGRLVALAPHDQPRWPIPVLRTNLTPKAGRA